MAEEAESATTPAAELTQEEKRENPRDRRRSARQRGDGCAVERQCAV